MLINELQNYIQLRPAEAPGTFKRHGFKPEFRHLVLASHVDVRRFAPTRYDSRKDGLPHSIITGNYGT